MPFCHFSRVFDGITIEDVNENNKRQIARKCKKIEYTEICRITVEPNEFDLLCRDISKPRCFYEKYAHQSYANSNGKWNCIVIKCDSSKQKIILYTAGYIYPLYVGISLAGI